MKILIGHNHYRWPGGEDAVVATEARLLSDLGHEVKLFETDNAQFLNGGILQKINSAKNLFWSARSYKNLKAILNDFKPQVAHFHNIYFSLTPSVYDACHDHGVAVIQSLHNFRMMCANGLFFRNGSVCEDCVRKSVWQGIKNRCYQDSILSSSLVTAITSFHRWKNTFNEKVDMYITATEFTRSKYVREGIIADKIAIKPNVYYPIEKFLKPKGEFVLYVGRLSREKGVERLLDAWEDIGNIPLKLMGEGPLEAQLKSKVEQKGLKQIEFLGRLNDQQYIDYMQRAKFLIVPSLCYENFPRIVVEAFAFGLPVLASRLGSLVEIIDDGNTGCLFDPNNMEDFRDKIKIMWGRDDQGLSEKVLKIFNEHFSPKVNIEKLISIYNQAIMNRKN